MATVTGLTAARMLELAGANIVAARVDEGVLILSTRDGDDVIAGDIRGPQGDIGPAGGVNSINTKKGDVTITLSDLGGVPQSQGATESSAGIVRLATSSEAVSASSRSTAMTPFGAFSSFSSFLSAVFPPGTILMIGRNTAPSGWLMCQGQAVSRTTYGALFSQIGVFYGTGDGSTTFNLPDFRDRFPRGYSALTGVPLGTRDGASTHTHTEGDLAAAVGASNSNVNTIAYQSGALNPRGPATVTGYTLGVVNSAADTRSFNHHTRVYGTTASSSNVPQSQVVNFMIKHS